MARKVKINMKSTAGKYFVARRRGLNKTQSAELVGIDPRNVTQLENTQMYQAIEKRFFKDELLNVITLRGLANELIKNIEQDEDRGAKNKAIEIALSRIEPDKVNQSNDESVIIVLK